jgi:hypothetical protein
MIKPCYRADAALKPYPHRPGIERVQKHEPMEWYRPVITHRVDRVVLTLLTIMGITLVISGIIINWR